MSILKLFIIFWLNNHKWSLLNLLWWFKLLLAKKVLSHFLQWNGCTSEWIRLCLDRLYWNLKVLPHSLHLNALTSLWTLLWSINECLNLKHLEHLSHLNASTLEWALRWVRDFEIQVLVHRLHLWGYKLPFKWIYLR
jgi:hypothetical protein